MKRDFDIFTQAHRLDNMYFSPIRQVGEKAMAMAEKGFPVIKFQVGEPDFNTAETIKEATIQAIRDNNTHYAPNRGTLPLRKAIADKLKKISNLDYDPVSEILVTCGGAEVINAALLATLNPDDEAIVFTPAFMNYENLINMCGAKMVGIPLRKENKFQIDLKELESKVTDNTKLVIINNPCNPTGIVYEEAVLEGIAKLAVEHNFLVFSDEIYNEIIYDGVKCRSIATFPGMRDRTITMNGFSKAFAMTGWRVGYMAANSKLISNMLKVHQYATTCIPTFIQVGLAKAMNLPETTEGIEKMRQAFDKRRKFITSEIDRIGKLEYVMPQGAFYIFIDVSKTGMDGDTFCNRLLEEKYVACVPGSKLGDWCKDYIRISYATSEENLKEGFARIEAFLNE